jgi:uncharacterized protein
MNEQANTELVHKLYAAFERGDIQMILDNLTPDVRWVCEGDSRVPYSGTRTGPAQVLGFFQLLGGTQENQKLTTTGTIAQGDKVATYGRYSGTVKSTGKQFDAFVAHFFTFRDGKVSEFLDYGDTAQLADAYAMNAAAAG